MPLASQRYLALDGIDQRPRFEDFLAERTVTRAEGGAGEERNDRGEIAVGHGDESGVADASPIWADDLTELADARGHAEDGEGGIHVERTSLADWDS